MLLPLAPGDNEAVLYEALDIAMGYFERAGLPDEYEAMAASVILASYARGVRHRVRLANDAITALQTVPVPADVQGLHSFYPRLVPYNA
jgi:hypothetical protein